MILISGEALIDLIPDPVKANAYDAVLGGSPYNVAIGLARLGSQTAFVSRISADGNGEALAGGLADNGVDLRFVLRDKRPSTLAFVMRGTAKTGSRYSFYLDATSFDGPWPFPATWPDGGAPLARRLDLRRRSAPRRAGGRCAEGGAPARHRQLRSQHPPARDPGPRLGGEAGRAAGFARPSRQGERGGPPMALPRPLGRGEPRGLGEDRARASAWRRSANEARSPCSARSGSRSALPAVEVVDTVGAGDSFMSALLSAMDRDSALGAGAAAPSRGALERWLRFAAAASAITCTRKGSDPPTRAEVEAALKG